MMNGVNVDLHYARQPKTDAGNLLSLPRRSQPPPPIPTRSRPPPKKQTGMSTLRYQWTTARRCFQRDTKPPSASHHHAKARGIHAASAYEVQSPQRIPNVTNPPEPKPPKPQLLQSQEQKERGHSCSLGELPSLPTSIPRPKRTRISTPPTPTVQVFKVATRHSAEPATRGYTGTV